MLQWQSHITDSTDRDTILGNLDFLEDFAGAIMGDETLNANFDEIRKGIENGTLKPTDWKDSQHFKTIITELTNASSGKLTQYGKTISDQAQKISDQAQKISDQAQNIKDQGDTLTQQAQKIKDQAGTLTQYGKTISSHGTTLSGYGTRITNAETALTNHGSSIKTISDWKDKIDKIGKLASMTEVENLKTLINNEVSHWTREAHPKPIDTYKTLADLKTIAQPWEAGDDPERHINDLCTVIGNTQPDKGVSYRFIRHPNNNTYKWVKVVDNDGALALSKLSTFEQKYNQDSGEKKKSIDDMAQELKDHSTKIDKQGKKIDASYKVTVTTKGYIRNGEIIDGTTSGGVPVIRHTAYVYDIEGKKVTDTAITSKLTWTINKGRTTEPKQRPVTGDVCDVNAKDFVKGDTTPNYYDIELRSTF